MMQRIFALVLTAVVPKILAKARHKSKHPAWCKRTTPPPRHRSRSPYGDGGATPHQVTATSLKSKCWR